VLYVKQYWGTYRYVMESYSAAHTFTFLKAVIQPLPVPFGKKHCSPYRYLMESISAAQNGTL
jgi:hypothetical protein